MLHIQRERHSLLASLLPHRGTSKQRRIQASPPTQACDAAATLQRPRRWESQTLSRNLAALTLQAYLRRTGSSARWMQAKALVNLTVKRLVTRQRYAQRVRRACEEQRELQALLLNVRGGDGESGRRAARECDDAFSELRAVAADGGAH